MRESAWGLVLSSNAYHSFDTKLFMFEAKVPSLLAGTCSKADVAQ